MTFLGKLVAKQEEYGGYTTYVFENEQPADLFTKYISCVRYPNWETIHPNFLELGYITIEERIAGKDRWFDGEKLQLYKSDHVQFINFVVKPSKDSLDKVITL